MRAVFEHHLKAPRVGVMESPDRGRVMEIPGWRSGGGKVLSVVGST